MTKTTRALGPGEITLPADDPSLGLLQVLRPDGTVDAARVPALSAAELLRIYRGMLLIRVMDERLMGMQRQGRIGFYGEAKGQEAGVIGMAHALSERDWLVPALREAGAGIYRGLPLRHYIAQIFGNANDVTQGRQMPCHPGLRAHKYVTMSSCVANQLPGAMGMAWASKLNHDASVVVGCLGDGATSEPDFHYAAHFAGAAKLPLVLFCQNNQWAISTPSGVQTAAPTLACKALGYGIVGVRVDGNDVLAVFTAVKAAIDRARSGGGATMIESLTYRVSAHTSSDDPSRYRDESVTLVWRNEKDPIARFKKWLIASGHLDEARDEALRAELDAEVRAAVAAEEKVGNPPLRSIFTDVFAEMPAHLEEQAAQLEALPRQKSPHVTH